MENNRVLQVVLGLLLGYNAVFFTAHLQGAKLASSQRRSLEVQSLSEHLRTHCGDGPVCGPGAPVRPHRLAVASATGWLRLALCLTGMLFKWFILYLHMSYLVD